MFKLHRERTAETAVTTASSCNELQCSEVRNHVSKPGYLTQILFFCVMALMVGVFSSCDKDKDNQEETFDGVWQLSSCEKLVFKTDGKLLYYDMGYRQHFPQK